MNYKFLCEVEEDHEITVFKVYDCWGFRIVPLQPGRTLISKDVYDTERAAWKAAYELFVSKPYGHSNK